MIEATTNITPETTEPGKTLTIDNPNRCSSVYEISFGDAGSVEFTVMPGGTFTITTGTANITIALNSVNFDGITGIVNNDAPA